MDADAPLVHAGRVACASGDALTRDDLLTILYYMRLQRAVEDRGIKLYYQGKIPGAYFTGWGHEAIVVGATYALGPQDLIAPMHRDLAAYIMRGISVARVFAQFLDREGGPTRGRDGNVHMGDPRLGILPFISHMAASVPVAAGMALACRQRGEDRVVLTFFGDGATSTGAWHEGVNFAAVMRLPVVLVLENNQYAYSTPLVRQTAARALMDKAVGYGMPGAAVDGNDVLAVFRAAREAVARARRGEGPTLIECRTMRVRGHSEADRYAYVPQDLLAQWRARDPIALFERLLQGDGVLTADIDRAMRDRIAREIEDGLAWAEASPEPSSASVAEGVYAAPEDDSPWR
ncbi:MAG: thiamine pyrophosphate-dependent dehydrogenase E1 component subunit alpha [Armatimonadota bacterium]|nr:thiamine pyrophosphate-dependent dehydrogenase E1 component subunit alpha [Armatimonadota bacterium]MDR7487016.1 thiamine pyrophosphate-dependent dehydrogenase E1 component subunit alpha [Armatimonadota bacterium]MDR7533406.1 thiamine pyrophosphate-dependent dehydrogenase E1 component subunit alpha [Armatimonadota bacterium]MDR7535226.1 thiamine pyrophosphate-dependent dehydrogenase E1 component subunit alpha [Armatimonadota bacterium]